MNEFSETEYNPDVLECIANLSNDEVFTPPKIANAMLDLLPKELFCNPGTKFLDPCCKSGVFLREIAKRLLKGLKTQIPDLQERVDHIFKNQIYGISLTNLTSLLSRRSVYCAKKADSKYSVTEFDNACGNIFFSEENHFWINGKCLHCGISENSFNTQFSSKSEKHAYQFIHERLPGEIENMKFDVIIGNPPYQMNVGNEGGNSSKAKAIYHKFIEKSKKLNPSFLIMITPSRWMTRSTEGISDEWITEMLNDNRIQIMHDFLDAGDVFPGVDIKGGVNYFLWNKNYNGKCHYFLHNGKTVNLNYDYLDSKKAGIVVRDINALSIIEKIEKIEKNYLNNEELNFSSLVSPKDFFTNKLTLTSSWKDYKNEKSSTYSIKYYLNPNIHRRDFSWVSLDDISKNHNSINLNKVYIPAAGGSGNDDIILGKPFYGEPNSVCSQTYLVIGYDAKKHNFSKEQCENIISYIKTRFFRYLVSIKKKTQNGPRGVYQFVPLQNFTSTSDIDWTKSIPEIDAQLYKKYNLTQEEIEFIESMIRPMP